jgi:hypothetical protein
MKKAVFIILVFTLLFSVCVRASADTTDTGTDTVTETTQELTETEPEKETDASEELARTFLNLNLYIFGGAAVLAVICTVIYVILKIKKKRSA